MADPHTDALVKAAYPKQWARANGKKRNQLRKLYRDTLEIRRLKTAGACCRTCRSYRRSSGLGIPEPYICEAHSDFHGYAITQPDFLCTEWKHR